MQGHEFRRRYTENGRSRDQLFAEVLDVLMKKSKYVCRTYWFDGSLTYEDLALEAIHKLIAGAWEGLRPDEDVYAFLYTMLRNLAVDHWRRSKIWSERSGGQADERDDRELGESYVAAEYRQEGRSEIIVSIERTCFGKACAVLAAEGPARKGSVRTIDVIEYVVLKEPSTAELAEFFGTTEAAAKERKSQVIKRLKEKCLEICGREDCRG